MLALDLAVRVESRRLVPGNLVQPGAAFAQHAANCGDGARNSPGVSTPVATASQRDPQFSDISITSGGRIQPAGCAVLPAWRGLRSWGSGRGSGGHAAGGRANFPGRLLRIPAAGQEAAGDIGVGPMHELPAEILGFLVSSGPRQSTTAGVGSGEREIGDQFARGTP